MDEAESKTVEEAEEESKTADGAMEASDEIEIALANIQSRFQFQDNNLTRIRESRENTSAMDIESELEISSLTTTMFTCKSSFDMSGLGR